jgi:hypothetical protein
LSESPELDLWPVQPYSASAWHLPGTCLVLAWHLLRGTTAPVGPHWLAAIWPYLYTPAACAGAGVRLLGAPPYWGTHSVSAPPTGGTHSASRTFQPQEPGARRPERRAASPDAHPTPDVPVFAERGELAVSLGAWRPRTDHSGDALSHCH